MLLQIFTSVYYYTSFKRFRYLMEVGNLNRNSESPFSIQKFLILAKFHSNIYFSPTNFENHLTNFAVKRFKYHDFTISSYIN